MSLDKFARKHYILSSLFVIFCFLIVLIVILWSISDDWYKQNDISTWSTIKQDTIPVFTWTAQERIKQNMDRIKAVEDKHFNKVFKEYMESVDPEVDCKLELEKQLKHPKTANFNLSKMKQNNSEWTEYIVIWTVESSNDYWVMMDSKVRCKFRWDWRNVEMYDASILIN